MYIPNGVGISDLLKAIKLAKEICDRCFRADQGADVKYQQFLRDVRILGAGLTRFQATLEGYEKQSQRQWQKVAQNIDASEGLWRQLIGDFYQTLQECDVLLRRYGYLRNGQTNPVFNLQWWRSVEPVVDRLMAKLKLHIDKVEFYTRPSEFEAVIRNGSEIQQLRRQVANLERLMVHGPEKIRTLWTDILPDDLKEKLESQFRVNSPSWSSEGTEWPLKEAFDALAVHFAASTVMFNPSPGLGTVPDLSQYLSLAKSVWILEKIRQSRHFQIVGHDSIWADRMRRYEDDLRGQLHRFEAEELEKPSLQELLGLPISYFSISDSAAGELDPLNAGEAGPSEEKILELPLASESDNRESALLVFRESETDFRLVVSTKQADSRVAQYDKEIEINMDRHRLIPTYANPFRGSSPQYNLLLLNERGKKPKELNFLSHEDATKLQRGLLGYRVHHEMPVARWCINGSNTAGDSGKGILQLWQFKPLPPMIATDMAKTWDANSSARGSVSVSSKSSNPRSPALPRGAHYGDAVHFVDWGGFPHTPLAEKSETCVSPTMFGPELKDMQLLRRTTSSTAKRDSYTIPSKSPSSLQSSVPSYRPYRNSSLIPSTASTTQSSVVSVIRGPRGDGVEFSRPELPVLVILTLCDGRYSFLHLTLDESIKVDPGLCGCRIPARRCSRVILKSKKHFAIRMLRADTVEDQGLESWDLSVFRVPRPDKLKKAKVKERISSLELQFVDEEEKNEFLKELISLENNRTTNQNDYEKSLRDARKRAKS